MDRKTKKLIKQLDHSDPQKRYDAVLALGRTGNTELIDTLERVATLDESPKVRNLAQKAVNTLEILRQRELEAERQAQLRREAQEYGEDQGVDWKPLAVEKLLRDREVSDSEEYEEWSYVESKKRERERLLKAQQEAEARRIAEEKARIRRRRPFRIFVYTMTFITVIIALIAIWYTLTVDEPPKSRTAALKDLQSLVEKQRDTIKAYEAQLVLDPIDCKAITNITIPGRPRWLELNGKEPSNNRYVRMSEDLSRVDEEHITGLDLILAAVNTTDTNLHDLQTGVKQICEGRDTLPLGEWIEYPVMISLISDEQLGAGVLNTSAAASILAELYILPPETRTEALNRLKTWLDLQTEGAEYINDLIASDPLNCLALRNLGLPERPRWIAATDPNSEVMTGLTAVIDALDEVDRNLGGMSRGIETGCLGRTSLPQAEWSSYPQIVGLNTSVQQTIEAAKLVIDTELATAQSAQQ
jgi:hypothetical protein